MHRVSTPLEQATFPLLLRPESKKPVMKPGKNYDIAIVGAGLTGAVMAERAASSGASVLVVERREHIGGNCYDARTPSGILYHVYGPHLFHTQYPQVVEYLSRFTQWYDYEHRVLAHVNARLVPVPFNLTSLKICFPETESAELEQLLINTYGYGRKVPVLEMLRTDNPQLRQLARYIYDNIFAGYTAKQWGMPLDRLDTSVSARVPVHISHDDRYFQDDFQKMPVGGFTPMITRMLTHKNIDIQLNTPWENVRHSVSFRHLIYTGSMDNYFDYCFGELPYRSLRFTLEKYAQPMHQPVAQVNYPNNHTYTRITEMPHISREFSTQTLVALEYPIPYMRGENEPYYPIPSAENSRLFEHYREQGIEEASDVTFAGRLGEYKYYNMDQSVALALQKVETILQ